ncbi:MAG: hypothetical protein AB7I33_04355 [Gemmatimonadales bacterium]
MNTTERWIAAAGVLILLVYLTTATGLVTDTGRLTLVLVFAIGPGAIVGILQIIDRLAPTTGPAVTRLCRTFLVTAFALFTLMIVVQQTVAMQLRDLRAAAPDAAAAQTLGLIYRGVNLVQLGIDVTFDIFYCIGVIILAAAMFRHRDFGRLIGILGIVSGAGLLILNLASFPYVPAESGLVDLGPVTGVWWLLVIVQMFRSRRRQPPEVAVAGS